MEECCMLWKATYCKLLAVITQSNNKDEYEKNSDEAANIWNACKRADYIIKHIKDHGIKRSELKIISMLDTIIEMNKEIMARSGEMK